ncbi:MAG: peptidoglycan editing factor PgeF [Thermodesulfobacteriota bacterium]
MDILNRSTLKTCNGLFYFEIAELAKLGWIRHAFLTRKGGVSLPPYDTLNVGEHNGDRKKDVYQNRDRIITAFGIKQNRLILLKQMQEDDILILKEPIETTHPFLKYDATITNVPNTFLGIQTADCIPILVVDQKKRVIGTIHAGRQGTALRITRKVLAKMVDTFGSSLEDLIVALGPSIGSCCYEIDEKVFSREWTSFSTSKGGGRWMVDLARINIAQAKEEGIKEEHIFWMNICTRCHGDLFFSYRGEGQTGRQLSFIGIL